MSTPWETLRKLPALRIPAVLEALEAARLDTGGSGSGSPAEGSVPLVTLMLRSGLELNGYVIRRDESGHLGAGGTLLLQRSDSAGRLDDDLTYVTTDSIDAVTVHGASRVLGALSGGLIEAPPSGPVPTRLGLSRRAEELGQSLTETAGAPINVEIVWNAISGEDTALYSLAALLEETIASLRQILEENGPEALAQPIRSVRLEQGPAPTISRDDQTLIVHAAFDQGRTGRLSGPALKRALEAVL